MKKIITMLTALIFVLAGCGSKSNNAVELTENVSIELWHPFTGEVETKLKEITDKFNKENEMVTVNLVNQGSYQDLNTKLIAAKQSNTLPPISFAYSSWEDLRDDVEDLNGYADTKGYEMDFSNFIDGYINEVKSSDGKIYGVPFNKSTEVVYYNKDLFAKAGVEKQPTTMEELFKDAKQVTDKTGVVGIGADSLLNYLATTINSCGLNSWQDEDGKFVLNDACIQDGVKIYQDGIKGGYARTAGEDGYLSGPFGSGQVAAYIGSSAGASYVATGVADKFDWGAIAVPQKSVPQQGTNLVIYSSASAEEKTAAWQFIQYISQDDVTEDFATSTGYLPVTKAALDSSEYEAFRKEDEVAQAAYDQTDRFGVVVPNFLGANTIYSTNFSNTMSNILDNNEDVKKALDKLNEEAQAIYDRNN